MPHTVQAPPHCVASTDRLLDHAGNHLRLGTVTDIGQDRLDDGSERRTGRSQPGARAEPLPKLCDELRTPSNLVVRIIEPVPRLSRPEEQADVAGFLAEHPLPQAAKRVEQVLERQGVNVALRQREEPALASAFQ